MRSFGRPVTIVALIAALGACGTRVYAALPTPALAASSSTVSFARTLAGPSLAAMYPSGLIWDPGPCAGGLSSCVVVADSGYNRISIFNPADAQPPSSSPSTPVLSFGSLGSAPGQFSTPRDVAVDPAGNIYVADADNSRIQAFSDTGTFRWQAGMRGPGSACTSTQTAPCLNVPLGISFDATNDVVLVADTGHSLIKAFSTSGTYLWSSPAGLFSAPREARRGPGGMIWVDDYKDEEVRAFTVSAAGVWSTTPSMTLGDGAPDGHGNGELNAPYNVAFSPDGSYAYVADTGNQRIAVWNIAESPPVWIENIGSRCPSSCPAPPGNIDYFNAIRRVTVDPATGDIWAADFWGSGLHEFAALPPGITSPPSSTDSAIGEIDGGLAPAPGFAEAFGVAAAPNGSVYVVDRLNQRVEQFNAAGTYVNDVGSRGVAPGTFCWPETVAVAPNGTVWVGDTRNARLQGFAASLTGKPTVVGSMGSALGQFNYIDGVATDSAGNVWVADTINNRIVRYTPSSGTFTAFGTKGSGAGQVDLPQGVAVSSSDVYVADTGNNRVEEFGLNGNYVAQYDGLDQPQDVALAPDGSVWVADTGTSQTDTSGNQIVQLSSTLGLLSSFGGPGNSDMQFYEPHSLAIYGSTLYVADTFNNRVQEYTVG